MRRVWAPRGREEAAHLTSPVAIICGALTQICQLIGTLLQRMAP
jgi:hypothetical protein